MIEFLEPLLDVIAVLIAIRMIYRFVMSFSKSQRAPGAAAPPRGGGERAGGTLVQDPQCGTYILESRAVRDGSGRDAKYFCSAKCRDAYVRKAS